MITITAIQTELILLAKYYQNSIMNFVQWRINDFVKEGKCLILKILSY